HIKIHERALRLSSAPVAIFAPGVTQSNSSLARVYPDSEHVKVPDDLEHVLADRNICLKTQTALPHSFKPVAISAEFIIKGRQFRGTHDIKPIRIDDAGIVTAVDHCETVDFEGRGNGSLRRRCRAAGSSLRSRCHGRRCWRSCS